jgi:hypothetical protein
MDLDRARWVRTIVDLAAKTVQIVLARELNARNAGLKSVTTGWIAAVVVIARGMMMARVIAWQVVTSTKIAKIAAAVKVHVAGLNAMIVMNAMVATGCGAAVVTIAGLMVRVMSAVKIAVIDLQCVVVAVASVMIAI